MSNKNIFGRSFGGKGYYIALILCAAAIGISGYLYYRNQTSDNIQLEGPTAGVDVLAPTEDNLQAVATDPNTPTGGGQNSQTPTRPLREPLKTASPLQGQTVMVYAMDSLHYNPTTRDWRTHNGIDIAAAEGTEVRAAADGVVYTTYEDDTMGTTVVIRHQDDYVTVYSSLDQNITVSPGDSVILGQTIGYVGATALLETAIGEHVHFSVTRDDVPIDPAEFLELG